MIYLLRPNGPAQFDTATAECDESAARLEKKGFERVLYEAWRDARGENDIRDRARLAVEDWLARQNEPAPDVPPGTVIGKTADGKTVFKG